MQSKQRTIAVIGLGYVGLMIAHAFGLKNKVIGFDLSHQRIYDLKRGFDANGELSSADLTNARIDYTSDESKLAAANLFIITVPTVLDADKEPDLTPLLKATTMVGKYISKDSIVVYECTVYPGVTNENCIPALEQSSGLKCGNDFAVVYSPERINPGDKVHTFNNIVKVFGATDQKTLDLVISIYKDVISAELYPVSSIKIAEACKIIENIQRDINIAYLNEAAMLLHKYGLELTEVWHAMQTKWNSLPFKPGLVGGHCIGINSHYLSHLAKSINFNAKFITVGREVNEYMPTYLESVLSDNLNNLGINVNKARIGILGVTFKEDCADTKDSIAVDMIHNIEKTGANIIVHDPIADKELVKKYYNITLSDWDKLVDLDAIVLLVSHKEFQHMEPRLKESVNQQGFVMDIKGILDKNQFQKSKIVFWQI